MKKELGDLLYDTLYCSVELIAERIKKGEASAKDLEVFRKLLADNSVTIRFKDTKRGESIFKDLPFEIDKELTN